MRDFMEATGTAIRAAFASFRDSMIALFDEHSTAEDVTGLMWVAGIALAIVVVAWMLKAHERRTIM